MTLIEMFVFRRCLNGKCLIEFVSAFPKVTVHLRDLWPGAPGSFHLIGDVCLAF